MMNIEALLERYYNGDTTLEEEAIIREYLAIHPEAATEPDLLLFAGIDALKEDAKPAPLLQRKRSSLRYWLGGSTALAAGLALFLVMRQQPVASVAGEHSMNTALLVAPDVSGEITDEQQALEQARKALAFVSSKLNKGTSGIGHLNQLEESVSKIQNKEAL